MTVYNVNLGIGWASSGVEYAQAYRAHAFEREHIPAKFIFSDLILANNIEDLTANLGFKDKNIIWLYNFFTDVRIAPSDYPVASWEKENRLAHRKHEKVASDKEIKYLFLGEGLEVVARLHNAKQQTIDQVSYVTNGVMVKRDFYSYVKYASEYYSGTKKDNHVTFREFYNEDGSIAYTEHLGANKQELFEFPNQTYFYSKNDLYLKMIKKLNFQAGDMIILDRMGEDQQLDNGQLIFEHYHPAKLVVVVHADHYDAVHTGKHEILWNNFYEYAFTNPDDVTAYVVATDQQRDILKAQQKKYYHQTPTVVTIPVGSLDQLRKPNVERRAYSLITASRLASEKHINWLIKAVVAAQQKLPELTLDIYGQGVEQDRLKKLIDKLGANDYIHLMGQHDLTDLYVNYAAYVAASTSEGFGLSLLEAVGSGLPIIGFDVPYGNQTFINDDKNGYLLPYQKDWTEQQKVDQLTSGISKLFNASSDLSAFSKRSYDLARPYLRENVAKQWAQFVEGKIND